MKEETTYHIPVLLMPSVDGMNIRPNGTYVDVTFAWETVEDCLVSTRMKMPNGTS